MDCVTVSPKYQIVIPVKVREALKIRPGDKIQVIQFDGRIELVPLSSPQKLRGFLRGVNPSIDREAEERL
ncbi:MAG: AbrB/MazE/SpoVT family DNA-binding domain-containing protein [Candidatus Riflebacteria bacterium]|nr:AbrB/MazE/SpoVT family DNA-binding domain-containing protein [Candidatus Riflebacteria bacterium]